jgi:UDP-N-acetylmuramoyl-L-alanine---L-glutamate ligase
MDFKQLDRYRVALWGYGLEGAATLARLRERYPEKLITIILSKEEAANWNFGGDDKVVVVTDTPTAGLLGQYHVIFKSPGISPYQDSLEWARFRGARFVSGSQWWFNEHAQDHTIAITGTKGKSTTASMIAFLLRRAKVTTALAGNIGLPLLELLEPHTPPAWWVIELSSYQTYDFAGVPAMAVVLNLFPEHLPWHGNEDRYYADKLKILADGRVDLAVLNGADTELMRRTSHLSNQVRFNVPEGWHVRGGAIFKGDLHVLDGRDTRLQGEHNLRNACAALCVVENCGFDATILAAELVHFMPLPHRLQRLGTLQGIEYVNDSISTTPHASIAALQALQPRKTTIIVGGFDRGLSWEAFSQFVKSSPPQAIIAVGENKEVITRACADIAGVSLHSCATLAQAVELAQSLTPVGGTILLSPGAPSFDMFVDYAERGARFAEFAGFAERDLGQIEGLGIR